MTGKSPLDKFFDKEPIELSAADEDLIEAFSLDKGCANKTRASLNLGNISICDYLLIPDDYSPDNLSTFYLIEKTNLGCKLGKEFPQKKRDDGKSKHILKKIKEEELCDIREKISETLLLLKCLVIEHYESLSMLHRTERFTFALIIPSTVIEGITEVIRQEPKNAIWSSNLKNTLEADPLYLDTIIEPNYINLQKNIGEASSKSIEAVGLVSLMNEQVVWSYKKFAVAFKEKHPAR